MPIPNRLQHEKSPYLLQHAHNPVDWFPWGDEAFEKALREDKPIFLSVGYSTCYWCHVMEREVFENPEIAQRLNEKFVSIKVDREERPDVDRIYMTALQSMSGSGGWPMSMFLTPDRKPFFGATYIPPVERYGRAGFPEVIDRLYDAWTNRRSEVEVAGKRLQEHLAEMQLRFGGSAVPTDAVLEKAHTSFVDLYDPERGGFGGAPKFPRPVVFNFLFRYAHRRGEDGARGMALQTLDRMHAGGMYDHVGGGFHRYSTDAEWHVPHFEKMLYDQAQLVGAYLEAYQMTGSGHYAGIARHILQYVERDMLLPEGAFASAEDAESVAVAGTEKKKEGAYYAWSYDEINAILDEEEAPVFCAAYDVREQGNVVHDPHQEFTGLNILRRLATLDDVARGVDMTEAEVGSILHRSLEKLRTHRSNRPRPYRDDKVVASWNGMMISAFARAASVLNEPAYLAIAEKADGFVMGRMTGADGRLSRRYRDGEAKYEAGLEDYACVAQAALDLYEATFREEYIERAAALVRTAVELFSDTEGGGFFDTVSTDGSLIARMKESYDGAEPSGNSAMACVLLRLSALRHDDAYRERAERLLKSFSVVLEQAPQAAPQLLVALDAYLGPAMQIILRGRSDTPAMQEMVSVLRTRFLPRAVMVHADGISIRSATPVFTEFLRSLPEAGDDPAVFVCENFVCRLPARSAEDLRTMLA